MAHSLFRHYFLLLILLNAMQGCGSAEEKRPESGPRDELSIYSEAVSRIKQYAAFVDPKEPTKDIITGTISAYLHQMDPYSDYLTPQEYTAFKQAQSGQQSGVGMEIEKAADGGVLCFPSSGSPAERAGIRGGDRLERIDGRPVQGKSVFGIAAMAKGRSGSRVAFTVRSGNGAPREVVVTRANLDSHSVATRSAGGLTIMRIEAFTANTRNELAGILPALPGAGPMVIDLRGNGGGDLVAAVDSARLFLKKGARVISIRMRSGLKIYDTRTDGPATGRPLYIWQDGRTASAAEAFVAALTGNGRAVSIGSGTFGKGSRQDVMALTDGSALVLTTGYLETPAGVAYDKKGLAPLYPLAAKYPAEADYLSMTRSLLRQAGRR